MVTMLTNMLNFDALPIIGESVFSSILSVFSEEGTLADPDNEMVLEQFTAVVNMAKTHEDEKEEFEPVTSLTEMEKYFLTSTKFVKLAVASLQL